MEELLDESTLGGNSYPKSHKSIGESWEHIHQNMQKALRKSIKDFSSNIIQKNHCYYRNSHSTSQHKPYHFMSNVNRKGDDLKMVLCEGGKVSNQREVLRIQSSVRDKLKSEMNKLNQSFHKVDSIKENLMKKKNQGLCGREIGDKKKLVLSNAFSELKDARGTSKSFKNTNAMQNSDRIQANDKNPAQIQTFLDRETKLNKQKTQSEALSSEEEQRRLNQDILKKNLSKVNIFMDKSHSVYELNHCSHLVSLIDKCPPIHSQFDSVLTKKDKQGFGASQNLVLNQRRSIRTQHSSGSKEKKSSFSKNKENNNNKDFSHEKLQQYAKKGLVRRDSKLKIDRKKLRLLPLVNEGQNKQQVGKSQ